MAQRLSLERLSPYLASSGGDLVRAIRLYEWNAAVSGALFEVLADVEVILRNAIHTTMTEWSISKGHGPNWYDNSHGLLEASEVCDVAKARARVGRMHDLRNRIAHHEPIHTRRIDRDLLDCMRILSAICPETADWVHRRARVEAMLENRPV